MAYALLPHIAFALAIFVVSAVLTLLMARHVRIMDVPNERSSHARPVPKSGGVAIVAAFVLGSLIIFFEARIARIEDLHFWVFLCGTVVLAGVSLYDDITQKSFVAKLATQLLCVAAVAASGLIVTSLWIPGVGETHLGWFAYVVTFLWIGGFTNTCNFMDGLDGLVGGVAVIAGAFLCVIAFTQQSFFVYATSYALTASIAGFLLFNVPPARIFMGDVGSAFIGFAFAALAVIGASLDRGHLSFYVIPMLFFQFIFDTAFTFVRRVVRGEKVHQAHRTHLYQLLNRLGYSHRSVTLFHCAVALVQGFAAFGVLALEPRYRASLFAIFLALNAIYAFVVVRRARAAGLI
ncbi:MAG: undecaprenyl/decaprenyl-phosphate alpha-N-acetylglucosaminyl 1-phosphate transferase [Betaproteobacteria bacterium]|nr:undecaprenyl/decaprenyl-phosphate alpha-N-acetylglucosaminyl 1-phosphate transferase [Betaproteobacteria bacterium]